MELLSPVGNFDCLKAAVQNGADAVYFGAGSFNARAFADNFDSNTLKEAILYAKSRGVKTNLTLNTLIKPDEFDEAFELAKTAYEFGIDAIIVQDLGLAKCLIKAFPDLAIHASTQMSVHNLEGVLELQKLGFKRVVLARELSVDEIDYICRNSNIEIECFIHGALCISCSGQCLFSSLVGGRSGNRGKCAQPCRLPYELYNNSNKINSGYLLSTRDIYGLPFILTLLQSGVSCFKIEGRMKSPEYVATVTRIYRKYIDLALSGKEYVIDEKDRIDLLQVFNRGNFSSGHLSPNYNKKLIYKEKQNNMGLYLGKVTNYNQNKGYITLTLKAPLSIGDTVSLQNETGTYTISELMVGSTNVKSIREGNTVTIGRMKGNIRIKDNIYKMSSKELSLTANESFSKDFRKIPLNCKIDIIKNQPLSITITSANNLELYKDLNISFSSSIIPIEADNKPLTKETVIAQISRTANTKYIFNNIEVNLDDNVFLPKFSSTLNELRRTALEQLDTHIEKKILRTTTSSLEKSHLKCPPQKAQKEYSLLLNVLSLEFDYSKLDGIDNIYIPFKFFLSNAYAEIIRTLSNKFNVYIYMPTIIKKIYNNLIHKNLRKTIASYNVTGIVLSNISNFRILEDLDINNLKIVCNYTLNVFNDYSIYELMNNKADRITLSPELDRTTINKLACYNSELIVYGNTPLMTTNYCLLGESNKCYSECSKLCNTNSSFYLKDRLGYDFRLIPDNIDTVTTIYNSKITFINCSDITVKYLRIDVLNESIEEINEIVSCIKTGKRLEGNSFTNGNLNRDI